MFRLPRRRREPFDDNRAQVRNLIEMENNIMKAIEDAVEELRSAIASANDRFQNVSDFETKLAEERAKFDALVVAEDAEDVAQNQELADARAATDAALAEMQGAADALSGLTEQVNNLGTVAAETPEVLDGGGAEVAPVDAEPSPEPAPADAPVDTPAEASAPADSAPVAASGPTPDPQSTENMRPAL